MLDVPAATYIAQIGFDLALPSTAPRAAPRLYQAGQVGPAIADANAQTALQWTANRETKDEKNCKIGKDLFSISQ